MKGKRANYKVKVRVANGINSSKVKGFINGKLKFFILVFLLILLATSMYYYFNIQSRVNRLIKNKEYIKAIELINTLLQKDSSDNFALRAKGQVYFMMALYNSGTEFSEELVNKSLRSLLILKRANNKEYIKSDIYFFLGCLYFIKAQISQEGYYYNDALGYLKLSYRLDHKDNKTRDYITENGFNLPLNGRVYSISFLGLIAYISYSVGDYSQAVLYFEEAIKEGSGPSIYYLYLALSYRELSNYDKAIEKMQIVTNNEKKTDILEQSYYILGKLFILKGDYSKAEEYIRKVQKLSLTAESYYQLGLIYEAKNNINKAIIYWQRAIKKDYSHNGAIQKLLRFSKGINKQ